MDRDKHKLSIVTTVQIKLKWGDGREGTKYWLLRWVVGLQAEDS